MTSFTKPTTIFSTADDPATAGSSSPVIGPNESITTASIIRSGHLPTPRLGIIGEIEKAIKALARTQTVKERICEYIQQEVSITNDVTLV